MKSRIPQSHRTTTKTTGARRRGYRLAALALALALSTALTLWPGAAAASCNYLSTLASQGGPGDGLVLSPRGLATDSANNVFVADQANNRVQKFNSGGVFQLKFGSGGSAAGQFVSAFGVAVDGAGNIYVTDSAPGVRTNGYVQKFSSSGAYITGWGAGGQFVNGAGGVAVDSANNVYVANPEGNRIYKFTDTGTLITSVGSVGAGNGLLSGPQGVAVDASDNLYVADTGNNRVQVFNSAGTYVRQFGSAGAGDGQFNAPIALDVDTSGNVYVADLNNNRTQKFDSAGNFVSTCGGPAAGNSNNEFNGPQGIAVDSAGNVYVGDTNNDRVQKFGPAVATPPTANAGPDQTVECAGATTSVTLNGSASAAGSGTINSYSWSEGATLLGTGSPLSVMLPAGSHTITLTVTDTGGGSDTDDVIVNIADTTAPVINVTAPNPMTVECHTTFTDPGATATDACAGSLPVTSSGTVDENTPGPYTITYTATDGTHTATATRTVNVVDTSGPTITINPNQQMSLWPANHKYQTVTVTDFVLSASDACDSTVNRSKVYIVKITSDEIENGNGDGNTSDDIVIAPGCKSAQLRAEREGGGDGRVYTITFKVVDAAGNFATATATVTVPKSQGGNGGAVNSGVHYTVNSSCP
jgi:sugar lactone lactonase YvrE